MFVLGRIELEDPESFPESIGNAVNRVGAVPVPGPRSGVQTQAGLSSFTGALDDTAADRERVRRQFRSLLNNIAAAFPGVYVAWTEDPEHDGWYTLGTATIDLAGTGALASAFWRFTGVDLALNGRPRTHRRGFSIENYRLPSALYPRDYLGRIYHSGHSAMPALALAWMPSEATDPTITSIASVSLSGARQGRGGMQTQAIVNPAHNAVVSFEQGAEDRNLGDVVAYDRRGVETAPTTGPDPAWDEFYGPDWPYLDPTGDVPVLDNYLCRVRWDSSPGTTPGFALDRWNGTAYAEVGKVLIRRIGDSAGFCDTLLDARLVEWTPDGAVVKATLKRAADTYSREDVYVTLRRGWSGPQFEVYPAAEAAGTKAGAAVVFTSITGLPMTTALKQDAAASTDLATRDTASTFSANYAGALVVGSATFTGTAGAGENWLAMTEQSGSNPIVTLATLHSSAVALAFSDSAAYGIIRNGIAVSLDNLGWVGVRVGLAGEQGASMNTQAEALTLAAGTTAVNDDAGGATPTGGSNTTTTSRTAEADHVTVASWRASRPGIYRVLARVRNTSAGTANVRAQTTATTGSAKTTTSTTYVWLDLGQITADGSTLRIRAWRSTAGNLNIDRVLAIPVEAGTGGLYDGSRDVGREALNDVRTTLRVVPR